nr:hypothetical protein [Tanacetum cinerariifolium]
KFPQALQTLCEKINKYVQEKQEENNIIEEQSPKVSSQYWKPPIFFDDDDNDDEESSIPLRDIIYELPLSVAITPDFPIIDSLSMGDEHLSTIPEKELDKVIKSSVEDLVPIPCESKDLSDIESECDVLVCDDFKTFSNPLFDSYDDSTSSDDKSFSDDDVLKENFKIYSKPLFDEEVISTKIDPHYFNAESDHIDYLLSRDTLLVSSPKFDSLLEEFSGELAHIDLISPEINEANLDPEEEIRLVEILLYDNSSPRPPKELNFENSDAVIESFSPSPIPVEVSDSLMEEIDIFLASDDLIPSESDHIDYFLSRDTLLVSSPKFDSFLEEFSGELAHIDLISPEINEANLDPEDEIRLVEILLYDNSSPRPPKELNFENSDAVIESFSPSPIPVEVIGSLMEEIDIFLTSDDLIPPDDDGIYFNAKPDTGILTVKVVDDISERYVLKPGILPTQPTLSPCLVIDTLLPFSSENKDKVFNHGILSSNEEKYPHLLSY